MKNLIKKLVPIALALTFCIGAMSLAACGNNGNAEFKGDYDGTIMGATLSLTMKLEDGKADVSAVVKMNDNRVNSLEEAMAATGTYKFENNQYVVTIGEGESAKEFKSKYDESTKTYTIVYTVQLEQSVDVTLTYKA